MTALTSTLTAASKQWASRPADERFTSLVDMLEHFRGLRRNSAAKVVPTGVLSVAPTAETADAGLVLRGSAGTAFAPTHWSFGQLAGLAGAPAGYLRTLPAPIAADALNYGLRRRPVEEVGLLLTRDGAVRAATGPKYGRIWNADIVDGLVRNFGDGVNDSSWRVPGEFGKAVDVTKANTTLFAGDRDMFVFLADETNRIEIPNRRDGKTGSLARGFFVWNSEVGSTTFGISTFLFDYVCCNRIVWGATDVKTLKLRHSSGAPDRFLREIAPALQTYANSSAGSVVAAIESARSKRIGQTGEEVATFLATRFGRKLGESMQTAHLFEEGRPIETLWDAATAATAVARGIEYQEERVALERLGGSMLDLAA